MSNNPVPVFEMILESITDAPQTVGATLRHQELPAEWHEDHHEGQLSVDVAQIEKEVLVVSTMAGAETSKIEIYIHNELLTIRGLRASPLFNYSGIEFFHQECFWGKFSRTIVLPVEVKGDSSLAEYKNGVLTIRIPKRKVDTKIPVVVVED